MARKGIDISAENLDLLKSVLQKTLGRKVVYAKDCETLSLFILSFKKELVSTTTLKRIFGFAKFTGTLSESVLDSLARSCSYKSWNDFTESEVNNNSNQRVYWHNSEAEPYHFFKGSLTLQSLLFNLRGHKDVFIIEAGGAEWAELYCAGISYSGSNITIASSVKPEKEFLVHENSDVYFYLENYSRDSIKKWILDYSYLFTSKRKVFLQVNTSSKEIVNELEQRNISHAVLFPDAQIPRREQRAILKLHGFDLKLDRTTKHLEDVLAEPLLLKEFIDFLSNNENQLDFHPNIIAIHFVNHWLSQVELFAKLKSEKCTGDLAIDKQWNSLCSQPEIQHFARIVDIELMRQCFLANCAEGLNFDSQHELYSSFKLLNNDVSFEHLNNYLKTNSNHDRLSNIASVCHYLWIEKSKSYLSYPEIVKLCSRHIVDYRNLSVIAPYFYSEVYKLGTPEQKIMSLSMMLTQKLYCDDIVGVRELVDDLNACLKLEGVMHILPVSRALGVLYMAKRALGEFDVEWTETPSTVQYFAHFSMDLPILECFKIQAYIFCSEWQKAYSVVKSINLDRLVKIEFSTGVLKLLYVQILLIYKRLGMSEKFEHVKEIIYDVPESCFYMNPIIGIFLKLSEGLELTEKDCFGFNWFYNNQADLMKENGDANFELKA